MGSWWDMISFQWRFALAVGVVVFYLLYKEWGYFPREIKAGGTE